MKRRPRIHGRGIDENRWATWDALGKFPEMSAAQCVNPLGRAVVLSPHPDDEVLAMGGLIHLLATRGQRIHHVAVSDGEASHAPSGRWPARRLARVRQREVEAALGELTRGTIHSLRLRLPDGAIVRYQRPLVEALRRLLEPLDTVFTTCRGDGHPDHEAVGRAAARACTDAGCRFVELPVWTWHWASPQSPSVPWARARVLRLTNAVLDRKRRALEHFASQQRRARGAPQTPILPERVLQRFERPFEVYFV